MSKINVKKFVTTLCMTCKIILYYEIVRKTLLGQHVLHSLQGHASNFHELTNFLNLLKEILYLILDGTSSQIFGSRYLMDCKP